MFFRRPDDQWSITQEQLARWYDKLCEKAKKQGVVTDYTQLSKVPDCGFDEHPYFKGDVWAIDIEDAIEEMEEKDEAAKKENRELEAETDMASRIRMAIKGNEIYGVSRWK